MIVVSSAWMCVGVQYGKSSFSAENMFIQKEPIIEDVNDGFGAIRQFKEKEISDGLNHGQRLGPTGKKKGQSYQATLYDESLNDEEKSKDHVLAVK